MRTIKLIDTTLKESQLSFKEKLEIARCLDRLKVDAIELPEITGGKADQLSNKTIASMVTTRVSATVAVTAENVEETWESIRSAKHPQLTVLAPVSPVQMEYQCHKKAPAMLEAIAEQVRRCRYYSENVGFTAVDATRAEMEFLCEAVALAIDSGANEITLCDTAGILMPDELVSFLDKLRADVPALAHIRLYVQTSDAMHMATACAAAAIAHGADGAVCAASSKDLPSLVQLTDFIRTKSSALDIETGLRVTELGRTVSQIERIISNEKTESETRRAGLTEETAGLSLSSSDSITDMIGVLKQLGYDLSEEDNSKVYEAFQRVAAKKHFVGTRELEAIVASTALQVPSTYRVESYVINSGNVITATANVCLERKGAKMRSVAVGDGPIDAAFLAIEQIIGHHYELDDFQIQTVTEGREAMGSALVKLRADGKLYSGTGISTDIIGAAIRAYISALNKIVYEEELS